MDRSMFHDGITPFHSWLCVFYMLRLCYLFKQKRYRESWVGQDNYFETGSPIKNINGCANMLWVQYMRATRSVFYHSVPGNPDTSLK